MIHLEPYTYYEQYSRGCKTENKEVWVLFQDIKKVFDSVSLEMLKKVLEQIKILEIMIRFLLSLYNKRKIKVITEYRLT